MFLQTSKETIKFRKTGILCRETTGNRWLVLRQVYIY